MARCRNRSFKETNKVDSDKKKFQDSLKSLRKLVVGHIGDNFEAERTLEHNKKYFESNTCECIFISASIWDELYGDKNCAYIESNIPMWLDYAVRVRDSDLLNAIGRILYEGRAVECNETKAVECFKLAVELKNVSAMTNLAQLYMLGDGVEYDEGKAFELYKQAAMLGNKRAMIEMYVRYRDGEGVHKNRKEAVRWYERIKDKLSEFADDEYEMGYNYTINALYQIRYSEKKGSLYSSCDDEFARHYFGIAMRYFKNAIRYGRTDANYDLAQYYFYGYGVKKDLSKAIEYCDKAGNWRFLARCYLEGEEVEQSLEKAIHYYSKGDHWFYIGEIYRKAGDLDEAGRWYSKYHETYKSDDRDEVRKIARMYRDGEEYEHEAFDEDFDEEFEGMKLKKDTTKAIEYFKLIGDSLAVGEIYKDEGDFDEAVKWYEKELTGENVAWAIYDIAEVYEKAGDTDNAVKYYRMLTERNYNVPAKHKERFVSYGPDGKHVFGEYENGTEDDLVISFAKSHLKKLGVKGHDSARDSVGGI